MMIGVAAALLIGSLSAPGGWAEEPPGPRDREIREHEAQRHAEQSEARLDEARAELEKAEARYRQMAEKYEQAQATYEKGRAEYREQRGAEASIDAAEAHIADLERHLHELRMREVELEATAQQMEIAGRLDDMEGVRRELIELHRETQMATLEMEQQQRELAHLHERRELGHMQDRLAFIGHWRDVAFDPQQAAMMATQSLVEMHVAAGNPEGAVEVLEQLLEKVKSLGVRTALRFALKDLYGELDQPEHAKEHMIRVILENAGGIDE